MYNLDHLDLSHAGYAYSGPCAGYAYKQIDPSTV